VLEDNLSIKENHGLNCSLFNMNPFPWSYHCKRHMNQQNPKHQLINRLNNVCIKFYLCLYIIITSFQNYILCIKCKIWHLYCTRSILKQAHYYLLKNIVHVSFDCSIGLYRSICT